MVNRVQQDSFMDEGDDTCPLCVEEFDLSDKNFKPCPCGYQVCQFCYNNIKQNMNGLCPACRRPYDDKTIEWKMISPEEFKADIAAQAKKKAAARQKEAERKQVETLNRKHLAGLRVLQKNLVYVVGMDISGDENALETLRGPNHFGQYGDIIKIVASKAKEGYAGHQSTGIYVTFADQDAAKKCIAVVDGTPHEGRVLRAQYGTTKYCSAFLRNERCTNRGCMFLHETGDDNDSFSRADLSSLNAASSQRLAPTNTHASSAKNTNPATLQTQSSQPGAPPPATQPSSSLIAKAEAMSRSDSGDGSALPTTANWAKNPQVEQSRRSSQAASRATPSPKTTQSKLVLPRPESLTAGPSSTAPPESKSKAPPEPLSASSGPAEVPASRPSYPPSVGRLIDALKDITNTDFNWTLDRSMYDQGTLDLIDNCPLLIDPKGGMVLQMKKQQEQDKQKLEGEKAEQVLNFADDEENLASGSLQLGGEPENGDDILGPANSSRRQTPFGLFTGEAQPFERQTSIGNEFSSLGLTGRSLTPQQQRNISLLKSGTQQQESLLEQAQRAPTSNTSQHHPQLSNPFQTQNQQLNALSRHGRHASRFTFANETSSTSTAIKPTTNAQLMAQQSAMMPHAQQKNFAGQQSAQPGLHTNFYSGVQGPPPGLKASGTPPISGGGMFGQGHGFASAMAGGANFSSSGNVKTNEDNVRDLLRGRMAGGNNVGADTGKREFRFPPYQTSASTPSPPPGLYAPGGHQAGAPPGLHNHVSQKPKKKGKRHRHANTSSIGGGATVDLADPSILQARMHHTGLGQGPYGGAQNQGSEKGITATNPQFAPIAALKSEAIEPATPTTPPGLLMPADFPPLAAPSKPVAALKELPVATPTVSRSEIQPIGIKPSVTAQVKSGESEALDTAEAHKKAPQKQALDDHSIQAGPILAATSSSHIRHKSEPAVGAKKIESDSKLNSSQENPTTETATTAKDLQSELTLKAASDPSPAKAVHDVATTASAAQKMAEKAVDDKKTAHNSASRKQSAAATDPASPAKPTSSSTALDNSRPSSSGTSTSQATAPAPRNPRTLRLVPATKIDVSSKATAPSQEASASPISAVSKQTPQQPTSASTKQPGTPITEPVSDNASLTSASLSRPPSPPGTKVGPAPASQKSKNQAKKEMQVRAKQIEEAKVAEESASSPVQEEIVQAPIVGRKKKSKKPKATSIASKVADEDVSSPQVEEPIAETKKEQEVKTAIPQPREGGDIKSQKVDESEADNDTAPELASARSKQGVTAGSIFPDLKKAGIATSKALDLFLNPTGPNNRFDAATVTNFDYEEPINLLIKDRALLDRGDCIAKKVNRNEYVVVLPDRSVLRHFSRDEAERYVELRNEVLDAETSRFISPEYPLDNWMNFTSNDLLGGFQVAHPYDDEDADGDPTVMGPEELIKEHVAGLIRPDEKDAKYAAMYPPRTQSENDEIEARMAVMTVEEAEATLKASEELLAAAKKEAEGVEKKLLQIVKKNRKVLKDWL